MLKKQPEVLSMQNCAVHMLPQHAQHICCGWCARQAQCGSECASCMELRFAMVLLAVELHVLWHTQCQAGVKKVVTWSQSV